MTSFDKNRKILENMRETFNLLESVLKGGAIVAGDLTLDKTIKIYLTEVTPTKLSEHHSSYQLEFEYKVCQFL